MTDEPDNGSSVPTIERSPAALVPRRPGVLIVDDMGLILTLLKYALEPMGFTVWQAVNGDDGFNLYRQNRTAIDLVLLDVQMPGLDGPHALNAIRNLNPDVLACFMTGDPGRYTRADLLECGAACVFTKPFRATELAQSLAALLHESQSTALSGRTSRPRSRHHEFPQTCERESSIRRLPAHATGSLVG